MPIYIGLWGDNLNIFRSKALFNFEGMKQGRESFFFRDIFFDQKNSKNTIMKWLNFKQKLVTVRNSNRSPYNVYTLLINKCFNMVVAFSVLLFPLLFNSVLFLVPFYSGEVIAKNSYYYSSFKLE